MYRIKATLKTEPLALGTFVSEIKNPNLAYVLAGAGFDHMIIDNEHSDFSDAEVTTLVAGARAAGLGVIVRIPEISRGAVMKPLDSGADALLVPCVQTPEEVRAVVDWAMFPPVGHRGCHPRRAANKFMVMGAADYMQQANQGVMIFIQIETGEALSNVDEIAAIPGVAGLYLGPLDMSIALGIPGKVSDEKVGQATRKMVDACKKHGLVPGKFVWDKHSVAEAKQMGVRLLTHSADVFMLADAAARAVKELKG
jgi:2-keto-3-deoxy-L-rhamnonate aldolase RhmA